MDRIPYSAVALAIGMLIVVWFFLLDMIFGRTPHAHLRILLDVMSTNREESSGCSNPWSPTDSSK